MIHRWTGFTGLEEKVSSRTRQSVDCLRLGLTLNKFTK